MKKIILIILFLLCSNNFYAQLQQEWVVRYNGPLSVNPDDIPVVVKTDISGNIYVFGSTYNNISNKDYYLVKYNLSGAKQWEKTYDNPWHLNDWAVDAAVDQVGNIYVTGISENHEGYQSDDFLTIKYNSSGDTLWTRRYNGAGNYIDQPVGIQLDVNGFVYVAGESFGDPPNTYYCLIKYDFNGNQIWLMMNTTPPARADYPTSFKLDDLGNSYITGFSDSMGASHYAYLTLKINSSGNIIWKRKYWGPVFNDYAKKVDVDNDCNVYVTGASAKEFNYINYDYATVKYDSSGNQLWAARYNGTADGKDIVTSIGIDQSRNVFITGYSLGQNSNFDITTIKYNSLGVQQWLNRYDGSANDTDKAYMLKIDNGGNVFVTGQSKTQNNYYDFVTLKFSNSGNILWNKSYNGTGDSTDAAFALVLDNNSNVIITGESIIVTIKYNSLGVQQWLCRYNSSTEEAYKIILDDSLNIFIAGQIYSSGGMYWSYSFLTIKYNPGGNILWNKTYGATYNTYMPTDLAVDSHHNVYTCGYGSNNYVIIKYASDGFQKWVATYNGPGNGDDKAYSMTLDSASNIFVTGGSYGINSVYDFATVKSDTAGHLLWNLRYNGPGDSSDIAKIIRFDNLGNAYVCGSSIGFGTENDITLIKYKKPPIGIENSSTEIPLFFSLSQNYPNPFNPVTKIKFSLPNPSIGGVWKNVRLVIYDVLGREIETLIPPLGGGQEGLKPGSYEVEWDGSRYASGVYFYRLYIDDASTSLSITKKMVLIK